jgi:hypothetical protein
MAVAAFAAVTSIELPDRLSHHHRLVGANAGTVMPLPPSTKPESASPPPSTSALSGLQFFPRSHHQAAFDLAAKAPVASLPVINMVYQYARFTKAEGATAAVPSSSADALYRWHLPHPGARSGSSDDRSQTVVVLLGWLGSKQKHLKRYAEWYTSRGFHAVTFTLPMSDIVSYNVRGKAEKNVEMLSEHLADWVREEDGKKIVFHTFSNTGWLWYMHLLLDLSQQELTETFGFLKLMSPLCVCCSYGVILENLQRQDPSAVHKIKGSIVDSAPVAVPDSQVKTVANLR